MGNPIRPRGTSGYEIDQARLLAQHDVDLKRLLRDVDTMLRPPVGGGGSEGGVFGQRRYGPSIVVSMDAALYRTTSATGSIYAWNGTTYADTGDNVTVYGTFLMGYFFAGDYLEAEWSASASRYYGRGTGNTFIRGTLDGALADGGSATLSVTNNSGGSWVDSGVNVTVYSSLDNGSDIDAGTALHATWHEQKQAWVESGYEC